jgi:hypothetical protein
MMKRTDQSLDVLLLLRTATTYSKERMHDFVFSWTWVDESSV